MKLILAFVAGLTCYFATFAQASPLLEIRVETDDLFGTPISSIAAGGDFRIKVVVQDLRVPTDQFPGVFAAYLNLDFDNTLASIGPGATPSFLPTFAPYGGGASYFLTPNGTQTEMSVGSFNYSLSAPGNAPQVLFTELFHAAVPGLETFAPSYSSTPGFDLLLYDTENSLLASDVRYVGATLTIVPKPSGVALAGCAGLLVACLTIRVRRGASSRASNGDRMR
jgi:hypothetical protein